MLDPLTALSVASSVVQFVDYGSKVVGAAHKIYKSADGSLEEELTTEKVTEDLYQLSEKLVDSANAPQYDWVECEKRIQSLARECLKVAEELLDILRQMKGKSSRFKSWDALQKAVKSIRSRPEVDRLQRRLDNIRSQLSMHLLKALQVQQAQVLSNAYKQTKQQSSLVLSLDELAQSVKTVRIQTEKTVNEAKQELVGLLRDSQKSTAVAVGGLYAKIEDLSRVAGCVATARAILESLCFSEMPMRHIQIPEAYADTNAWIFEEGSCLFQNWLTSLTGVFWISGKAGSGKSTMVKFIHDHLETRKALEQWAGLLASASQGEKSRKLLVAGHYFWKSGYTMQKSLRGLYQFLLYHILHQCPDMIPVVCKERWHMSDDFHRNPGPWSTKELSRVLDAVLQTDTWPSKFCFFIDGLDEYVGTSEEQYAMVQGIKRLAACPHIKVCVSSRPWNVFRATYDFDSARKLVLQEHNKADLERYITGKLEHDDRFRRLASEDKRAKAFAVEIRQKANGVFLWVFLVVRSLLDGLTEADDISMLWERFRALPPTLEQYFDLMLKSIDSVYKRYTARALLLASNSPRPLPTLAYYYLKSEISDQDYAVNTDIVALSVDEIQSRRQSVISWINKWCRDLLEVVQRPCMSSSRAGSEYSVDFLHRTARDFLEAQDMQDLFEKDAGPAFSPQISLCRSYLAQIKNLVGDTSGRLDASEFLDTAGYVMSHAKLCEVVENRTPYGILIELDSVGRRCTTLHNLPHWTGACSRIDQLNPGLRESNFLSFAVEFDLLIFVRKFLERHPSKVRKRPGASLLEYAMRPTVKHETFVGSRQPLYDMISLLASRGAGVGAGDSAVLQDGHAESLLHTTVQYALLRAAASDCSSGSILIPGYPPTAADVFSKPGADVAEIEDDYQSALAGDASLALLGTSTPVLSYMPMLERSSFAVPRPEASRASRRPPLKGENTDLHEQDWFEQP